MTRRDDNPPDHTIENGVVVPGRLTINEQSLYEKREYMSWCMGIRMTRKDAVKAGYSKDEIRKEFGIDPNDIVYW